MANPRFDKQAIPSPPKNEIHMPEQLTNEKGETYLLPCLSETMPHEYAPISMPAKTTLVIKLSS